MNFQTKYLRSFFFPLFVCFVFAISACGGGGSSGGGGQSVAGTYSGTGSGTVTVGGNSQAFMGGFTIVIGSDGTVTYQEGGVTLATTTLDGNQFAIRIPVGVDGCTGTLDLNGTVVNGSITGTLSSPTVTCAGRSVTTTGTFSASKTAKAARINLTDSITKAMQ